jgi:hypothetical protein
MTLTQRIKNIARPFVPARLRSRWRRAPVPVQPPGDLDWGRWVAQDRAWWQAAKAKAAQGPPVLVATTVGGFKAGSYVESMLAVALTLRGANVKLLLCDKAMPACLQAKINDAFTPGHLARYEISQSLCQSCYAVGTELLAPLGLETITYSSLLTEADRREARAIAHDLPASDIRAYARDGMAVGEHAAAGALRFFARGQLDGEPAGEAVLRRFLEASLLTATTVRRLFSRERFDAACFNHGIYVPQGVIAEACRRSDVRVVAWHAAYRKSCFIFSHDDTYHHTLLSEPTSSWEEIPWSQAKEQQTLDYLASRLNGSRDWIWFHEKPLEDIDKIARECGVDFSKPVIGLLTNVFWDAQLHYRANAFADMLDWIVQTIRYFERRPDLQLLIRIHPAEVRGTIPSRQPLLAEIRKAFPRLPGNVFIIPPESNSSTYAAMYKCDSVLIYGTKTGVELTSVGIPVIVAGEAWIRGKGMTRDANSPQEYFRLLDQLPAGKRMEGAALERARKYAYHFFFRRMIPLPFMQPGQPFTVAIEGLKDLLPGRYPGLDVICDGILQRKPFVYPAEQFGAD